ncbi:MAG: hypothetical protein ACK4SM_03945 [Aquificaceae bacterium]
MVEKPLPQWIRQKIIERFNNKELALKAFEYVKIVEAENGNLYVKESLDNTEDHALLFAVLSVVNYTHRLLRGENMDEL